MRAKQNVAFVCHEYPPAPHGGIGTFTQLVARALVAAGSDVRVIGLYPAGSGVQQHEIDNGVQVFRLEYPKKDLMSCRARMLLYSHIQRWAEAGEIDILEVPDAGGWAAAFPKLPIPVVARIHGSGSYFAAEARRLATLRSTILYLIERASMRRVDYWCSVSRYAAEKTQQLFGLRPADTVTYNPVFPETVATVAERSPATVVFTGTLTPKKGIYSLVAAWPSVVAKCPAAELHVYGKDFGRDGNQVSTLLLEMIPAEVRKSIVFHGHQPREAVIQKLRSARAAVFPSYAEAFAFAPLEAMSSGCPTIYSRRCSGPELISDKQDGLLVDPDDLDEIADAIVRVLNDSDLADRLSRAGAAKIRATFTMDLLLPQIIAFYDRCVADFSTRQLVPIDARTAAGTQQ